MDIILSKKHGVNPSVEICHICGESMSVVLFGSAYKDENGKHTEAPREVSLGHVCDRCKKVIEEGGIFFIETRDGEQGKKNPYRTGNVIAVRESAVKKMLNSYAKVNFVEHHIWVMLFGDAVSVE